MQISSYLVMSASMAAASIISSMHSSPLIPRLEFTKVCHKITMNRYVTRDILNSVLEDQFCPDAVQQQRLSDDIRSISCTYNKDTPEEVAIMMDWKDKPDYQLNQDDCLHFLRDVVLDNCDESDSKNSDYANPMNWKSGGWLRIDDVISQITPLAVRPQAPQEARGGCSVTHFDHYHHVSVWGGGWANVDSGRLFEKELRNCNLLSDTFHSVYELGADGREWNATMYTTAWKNDCIADAAKRAGASNEFKCI